MFDHFGILGEEFYIPMYECEVDLFEGQYPIRGNDVLILNKIHEDAARRVEKDSREVFKIKIYDASDGICAENYKNTVVLRAKSKNMYLSCRISKE